MHPVLAARTSSYNECTGKDATKWLHGLEQADAVKHAWGVVVVDAVNRPPHAATRRAMMEGTFDHDSFAAFLRATPARPAWLCLTVGRMGRRGLRRTMRQCRTRHRTRRCRARR